MIDNVIKSLLSYDPNSGNLYWKINRNNKIKNGELAGRVNNRGHVEIEVNRKSYLAHRIAWLLMTGKWPLNEIDHIDGNRQNNQWLNLREVNRNENAKNLKLRKDNKTGVPGVYWNKQNQKWRVVIKSNKKTLHFGYYNNFEFAELLAHEAREIYHGKFNANHRVQKLIRQQMEDK